MTKETKTTLAAPRRSFTELERMALVQEYLRCRGSISASAFARSKGFGRSALYNWLRAYTSISEEFKLPLQENLDTMKEEIQDLAQLQAELARLRQECRNLKESLELANDKNEVLEALIYVTEQQLGYSLKKKPGHKR